MAKDDDGKKRRDGGGGAVFLVIVVLAAMAFIGDSENPLDRMADMVMVAVWVMAIALLIFVIFFFLAYCMQTAMSDLYESLMDDLENSPLRDKIEHYKSILDQKILRRDNKPAFKEKYAHPKSGEDNKGIPTNQEDGVIKEKLLKKTKPKKKRKPKPKTPEDIEKELEKQLEQDVLAMMDEESKKHRK